MSDIMQVFTCLSQSLRATELRHLTRVVQALLSMSGRVTQLGISRWAGRGGSYRTVQRFFNTALNWSHLQWLVIRTHLLDADEVLLVSGDHVVVTKAGKQTHGLDRFFSSLYGKTVPGLCFLSLSLISVRHRKSYPVLMEQVKKSPEAPTKPAKKQAKRQTKKTSPGRRGRPPGSKNRNRREVELSPSLRFIQEQLGSLQQLIGGHRKLTYFLFDGELGHTDALQMVRQVGLHLVSKLRNDSALYLPYAGPYTGRGPHRKYGEKLNYQAIPETYLQTACIEKDIETKTYQLALWHKKFVDLLNVVVIVKTNLKTAKTAHVVLFSSDLTLGAADLIEYYRLRFQLEFNFRDAKQYWGLEDFMSVKERPVYNSANLALFMVNVSQVLIRRLRPEWPEVSVNDLKAWWRGQTYVVETLKYLPEMPAATCIEQIIAQVAQLGRINPVETTA
jgi:putative transposase